MQKTLSGIDEKYWTRRSASCRLGVQAKRGELMDKKPPMPNYSLVDRNDGIERLYDAHEVAARCKVSEKSLHKWARQGVIPAVKFGRLWRFRKAAIDHYLDSRSAS